MLVKQIIEAKLITNLGVAYHRTRTINNVLNIADKGFTPGSGATYGRGLYLTYDINSQLNHTMSQHYGQYLIKFKISDLQSFLVYDEDAAKIIHPRNYTLPEQLQRVFKIPLAKLKGNYAYDRYMEEGPLAFSNNTKYSSDTARAFYLHMFNRSYLAYGINGIIFTGRADGRVIVVFNTAKALPLAYVDTDATPIKSIKEIAWQPLNNQGARQANKAVTMKNTALINRQIIFKTFMQKMGYRLLSRKEITDRGYSSDIAHIDYMVWAKDTSPRHSYLFVTYIIQDNIISINAYNSYSFAFDKQYTNYYEFNYNITPDEDLSIDTFRLAEEDVKNKNILEPFIIKTETLGLDTFILDSSNKPVVETNTISKTLAICDVFGTTTNKISIARKKTENNIIFLYTLTFKIRNPNMPSIINKLMFAMEYFETDEKLENINIKTIVDQAYKTAEFVEKINQADLETLLSIKVKPSDIVFQGFRPKSYIIEAIANNFNIVDYIRDFMRNSALQQSILED